jgi:hypothetical protein
MYLSSHYFDHLLVKIRSLVDITFLATNPSPSLVLQIQHYNKLRSENHTLFCWQFFCSTEPLLCSCTCDHTLIIRFCFCCYGSCVFVVKYLLLRICSRFLRSRANLISCFCFFDDIFSSDDDTLLDDECFVVYGV